MVIMLI